MRSHFSWPAPLSVLGLVGLLLGSSGCAAFVGDPARDARTACEKRDGASCFVAGNFAMEKGGESPDALKLYTRGCAARHSPSCEALAGFKGALKDQAISEGCNAGDTVSCARRAASFSTDEAGAGEARALRHRICKMGLSINTGTRGREVEGIAESCASLARMVALGQGGGRDEVAATKLEVLAMTLRQEALYRHDREDDAKVLPRPAQVDTRKRANSKRAPKADPTAPDRERFRTEYQARRAAREAWLGAVETSMNAQQKESSRGDPSMPSPTAYERATTVPGTSPGSPSQCQLCVDGCGSLARCAGDDFAGGRCGSLRCAPGEPCPPFETCVAECTVKADSCVKACGECSDPATTPATTTTATTTKGAAK